ncbi:cytochrome b5 domain-containing protein 1 isoform X1 [Struthio camelus]|uniref:cytochrome b5 domain-containing protein 1 isoform X1 n=1 Tax=Struthio camelus TaxID=8801 RepID=UPI0036042C7C
MRWGAWAPAPAACASSTPSRGSRMSSRCARRRRCTTSCGATCPATPTPAATAGATAGPPSTWSARWSRTAWPTRGPSCGASASTPSATSPPCCSTSTTTSPSSSRRLAAAKFPSRARGSVPPRANPGAGGLLGPRGAPTARLLRDKKPSGSNPARQLPAWEEEPEPAGDPSRWSRCASRGISKRIPGGWRLREQPQGELGPNIGRLENLRPRKSGLVTGGTVTARETEEKGPSGAGGILRQRDRPWDARSDGGGARRGGKAAPLSPRGFSGPVFGVPHEVWVLLPLPGWDFFIPDARRQVGARSHGLFLTVQSPNPLPRIWSLSHSLGAWFWGCSSPLWVLSATEQGPARTRDVTQLQIQLLLPWLKRTASATCPNPAGVGASGRRLRTPRLGFFPPGSLQRRYLELVVGSPDVNPTGAARAGAHPSAGGRSERREPCRCGVPRRRGSSPDSSSVEQSRFPSGPGSRPSPAFGRGFPAERGARRRPPRG